jgi:dephospho-CoA kinase
MIRSILVPDGYQRDKLKVGITGGIGSGKSTLADIFSDRIYHVFIGDLIARGIMECNREVIEKITAAFGEETYAGGRLNRRYLVSTAFQSRENLARLDSIVHPVFIQESIALMEESLKTSQIVFLDAAVIYEANMQDLFDFIILVTADSELRVTRAMQRTGLDEAQIREIILRQMTDENRKISIGVVIENNSDFEALESDADQILDILNSILANNSLC